MKYNNIGIKGTGSYLPKTILTNHDIELMDVGTSSKWIYDKLGIRERRIANSTETVSEMGYQAALRALEDANLDKEDIDLIIVSTSSPEQIAPSVACTVHNKLEIKNYIPSFDINAVCTGFVYALSTAYSFITSGTYENILIIASEKYSKNTDWFDRNCVFFGDGAGAIVLGNCDRKWAVTKIFSDGSGTGMSGFRCDLERGIFVMNGREVWDHATKVLPSSIMNVLNESNLTINDVKMLVPHQPSIKILELLADSIELPMSKVKTVMDRYANLASASIPVALDEAVREGNISTGDNIILSAVGSGWTWGSMVIQY